MNSNEQAVMTAVGAFLVAYTQADIVTCMAALSTQRPLMLMGTNEDEVICTHEAAKKLFEADFKCMSGLRWGLYQQQWVATSADLASVIIALPLTYRHADKDVTVQFRYAFTLACEEKQWKICAAAACVPRPAQTYAFP